MDRGRANGSLAHKILTQARPYGWGIAGVFLLELLATPVALLSPVPLKIAVDSVLGNDSVPAFIAALLPAQLLQSDNAVLVLAVVMVILVALIHQLQGYGGWYLKDAVGEHMVLDFRAQLFRHVQRLSLTYHDAKGSSDAVYKLEHDATSVRHILLGGIIPLITLLTTVAGMLYVTVRIDVLLALVALTVAPVLLLLTQIALPRLRRRWREVKQLRSAAMGMAQEALTSLRVVKAFGQEDREERRYFDQQRLGVGAYLGVVAAEVLFGVIVGLTTAAGSAAALYIGVRHVQSGILTLGELLIVTSYLSQLYEPLRTIGKRVASLQNHVASAERAFGLLEEAPDVPERPDALPVERAGGAVALRGVDFSYQGKTILHGIDVDVPRGTRVGIVGPTGAGKSTIVNLLVRFHDPTGGHILLDGADLRDYRLADLRRQYAIVLQEPVLFSTSIAENIAYGRPGAGPNAIMAAAKAAGIHTFIASLPDGYNSLVGERGMAVSGGERQRISLARAFLRDAPILILDEPTSSVDIATEMQIMAAMERLMEGRTVFMIAHRLETLTHCDLVLRLHEGRLLEASWDPATTLAEVRKIAWAR